ncbi:oxygenase [Ktedonobacteria bacterium brp13]|nr:oxygenase [Ktedonobacteria bacterium brp13]
MPTSTQADVFIVGGGPVGLTIAVELLRRGITCRIIEQQAVPATSSRALGAHARTQELFMAMSIYDEVRACSQPVNGLIIYENGERLGQFDLLMDAYETSVDATLCIGQAEIERILRDRVAALGGYVEFGTELMTFAQHPDGVEVTVRNTRGEQEQLYASYLIGCDGDHSRVRKELQIAFEGATDETWLVMDAQVEWNGAETRDKLQVFRSPQGVVMAAPFPEPHTWHLLATQGPAVLNATDIAHALSATISRALRHPVTVHPPTWLSRFTIQQRLAATMRVGRCFLAGDAAHVYSPASGQGLNTGIQDGYNLAWKLAQVLQGTGREILLDAYTSERRPVAERLLSSSLASTRLLSPQNALIKNGAKALKLLMQFKPLQQTASTRIARSLTGLAIGYPHSSIVSEDWLGPRHVLRQEGIKGLQIIAEQLFEEAITPGIAAGARVPDITISVLTQTPDPVQQQLFTLLNASTSHKLLIFTGRYASDEIYRAQYEVATTIQHNYPNSIEVILVTPSRIVAQQFAGLHAIIVDPQLTIHHRFGLSDNGLYLVRPDGYVGYRNQPTIPGALTRYLERIFIPLPEQHTAHIYRDYTNGIAAHEEKTKQ